MQRLTAELTEAVHLSQGHTRLFLPTEALDNPTAAVTDKASSCPPGIPSMLPVLLHSDDTYIVDGGGQLMNCGVCAGPGAEA